MRRLRTLLASTLGTLLVVVLAVPAHAGPAPFDEGERAVAGGTTGTGTRSTGSDPGFWLYAGYALAAVAVVLVVAVVAIALDRHAHHAPHPA
jgi:hypothetical protein